MVVPRGLLGGDESEDDDDRVEDTDREEEDGEGRSIVMRMAQTSSLAGVLQAMRASVSQQSNKQSAICTVALSSEGMHVQWEDETKNIQSQVMVRKDSFVDIRASRSSTSRLVFGVSLNQFADTLSLFASSPSSQSPPASLGFVEVTLRYPNHENQLEIEMCENNTAPIEAAPHPREVHTYAKLSTVETPNISDWLEHWQDPESSFHVSSSLLREAIEDLEWPGGCITLCIAKEPPQVYLSSTGQGSLSIRLPESEVTGLQCPSDHVEHSYNHKQLKVALTSVSNSSDESCSILTKVSISSQGILKVMHMVNSLQQVQPQTGVTLHGSAGYFESQSRNITRTGIVQYVILPVDTSLQGLQA
eukprot:CAMPEP_0198244440 /NCGR_PEP_ID=MMETSP1446-20131203/35056_1 /TAXON_ID=1461542 ORGANISM="Unidentified sp, Strain CCMP2111" /NCGR_SAMPLE_ID=MMETSP1446 /ASSEMBLY_ACC=CAM_ASM_001112 /LENGTH=360 /DNA_ID=CAMNT_0043928479 /DNA_START=168 /DNA_END=1250 /DNA_ORIENTATION=-